MIDPPDYALCDEIMDLFISNRNIDNSENAIARMLKREPLEIRDAILFIKSYFGTKVSVHESGYKHLSFDISGSDLNYFRVFQSQRGFLRVGEEMKKQRELDAKRQSWSDKKAKFDAYGGRYIVIGSFVIGAFTFLGLSIDLKGCVKQRTSSVNASDTAGKALPSSTLKDKR